MFEIKDVDEFNIFEVESFLLEVPALKEIDKEVLKNGFVVYHNKTIKLVISYKIHYNYALIRYFVYKKYINKLVVEEVFNLIEQKLSENNVDFLVAMFDGKEMFELYSSLDFELDEKGLFKDKNPVKNSKFKDTKIMFKEICSNM